MGLPEAISALLDDEHCDLAIELIKAHKRTQFIKSNKISSEHQLEIKHQVTSNPAPPPADAKHALPEYRDFICKHILSQQRAGAELTYVQVENLFIQEATMRNWFLPSDHISLAENKPRWKVALSDALSTLSQPGGPISRDKGKRTYVVNIF